MRLKKMSLANIEGKLSRSEMKKLMAGSGSDDKCGDRCDLIFSFCNDSRCSRCVSKNSGPYVCIE